MPEERDTRGGRGASDTRESRGTGGTRDRRSASQANDLRDLGLGRLGRELTIASFGVPLHEVEPWVVDRISALLTERWVWAGETLYRETDPPQDLYFMMDGAVRLSRAGSPSWTMRGRWVFGALEGIAGVARARTATALVDFQAMQVSVAAWVELLEDSFQLARAAVVNAARATAAFEIRLPAAPGRPPPHWEHIRVGEAPLSLVDRLGLLAEVRMLGGAGVQSIVDLAAASREVRFEAGATLLARDVDRTEMMVVVSGEVAAFAEASRAPDAAHAVDAARSGDAAHPEAGAVTVERRYCAGDIVCGAASFGVPARAWTARAATDVRVIAFPIEVWFDLMEEHFDLVRSTLSALASRRDALVELLAERTPDLVLT